MSFFTVSFLLLFLGVSICDEDTEYEEIKNNIWEFGISLDSSNISKPVERDDDFYFGYDGDDLAGMNGFIIQHYDVETQDGFILDMWRLNDAIDTLFRDELEERIPIIINPGLACDGTVFMNNNRTNSMAYMLFDEGYDVWIINNRGNSYSKRHTKLSENSDEYWQFTMHEQAKYDLTSSIDFVLNHNSHDKVSLIGHSMGSADILIFLIMHEEFGFDLSKINSTIVTAPAAISEHMSGMIFEDIPKMEDGEPEKILFKIFGYRNFISHEDVGLIHSEFSYRFPDLSYKLSVWACGEDSRHSYDGEDIYYYFNYYPSGTSVYAMAHYLQLIKRGGFQAYDYSVVDSSINTRLYGSQVPPVYDFDKIPTNIPILIMPGVTDTMAAIEDCTEVYNQLLRKDRDDVEFYPIDGYNHVDFMWGRDVGEVVYPKLAEFLRKYDIDA